MLFELDHASFNTVLAALRTYQYLQATGNPVIERVSDIAQPDGGPLALDPEEIDSLCDDLNEETKGDAREVLPAAHRAYIERLEKLWDLVSDTVEGARLTEEMIPDDYQAVVEAMEQCETARSAITAPTSTTATPPDRS